MRIDLAFVAAAAARVVGAVDAASRTKSATTAEEVAAHVIFSYPGATPPAELKMLASSCGLGGLIIFGENVNDQLPAYISSLQQAHSKAGCAVTGPLLVLTDQEGGQVRRLPGGPTLSEKKIGQASDPAAAASTAGSQAATALKAYNHNGNLAPVLDVFRQAGDFDDQYQRSYSSNASVAAVCGAAFVRAQQSQKIAATVKHFPGLGAAAANENTDERPVTINKSLPELRAVDERPYVDAIQAGVQMVMPSWALYPALDKTYPSGVSANWIQGELRQRLGFKGVVITDAIEAGGLAAFGSDDGYRAVLATSAGVDIVLASARNITQGQLVTRSLYRALQNGTLNANSFSQSTVRIQSLRQSLA